MVFLFILLAITIITLLVMFSKIQIQIVNFEFSSIKIEGKHINKNYKIIYKLNILGKIPIIKKYITREKMQTSKITNRIKQIDLNTLQKDEIFNKSVIKAIKDIKFKITNIDLKVELGTENACLTSIIVPAISTMIAIFLNKKVPNHENQTFLINPIYRNQNFVNIKISGIFEIKMIHIINIIYILNKKGRVKEYERTSNRRAYDYSYE